MGRSPSLGGFLLVRMVEFSQDDLHPVSPGVQSKETNTMAIFKAEVAAPYIIDAVRGAPQFQTLTGSGAMDLGTLDQIYEMRGGRREGQFVKVPSLNNIADFARVNLSSDVDLTATAADANTQIAPVLSDSSYNSYKKHDVLQGGMDINALWGSRLGAKIARRGLVQLGWVLRGAVPAIDSGSHVEDQSSSNLSVNIVANARYRVGDNASDLNVLFCHSKFWRDLEYDLRTNYNFNISTGGLLNNIHLASILGGIDTVVTYDNPAFDADDDSLDTTSEVSLAYLLGPDSIMFGFQHMPDTTIDEVTGLAKPDARIKVRFDLESVMHPYGMAFDGSANPADSTLGTSGQWSLANEDHKNVKLVQIKAKLR